MIIYIDIIDRKNQPGYLIHYSKEKENLVDRRNEVLASNERDETTMTMNMRKEVTLVAR